MIIRKEQMATFAQAGLKDFEGRMFEHVRRFFPHDCEQLGDAPVHEQILYGIERAKSYGIVKERDICKFVDVMFAFGRKFDANNALPWATETLNTRRTSDATIRVNRLFELAKAKMHECPPLAKKW